MYSPNVFFLVQKLVFHRQLSQGFCLRLEADCRSSYLFAFWNLLCTLLFHVTSVIGFRIFKSILFHEFNLDHNIISEDAFKIAFSGLIKADISSPQCAGSVCLLCLQKACKKAEHRQPLPEFPWYVQSFENGIKHRTLVLLVPKITN